MSSKLAQDNIICGVSVSPVPFCSQFVRRLQDAVRPRLPKRRASEENNFFTLAVGQSHSGNRKLAA
jgi:hypothetical protein